MIYFLQRHHDIVAGDLGHVQGTAEDDAKNCKSMEIKSTNLIDVCGPSSAGGTTNKVTSHGATGRNSM